jgi:hypothetical protein
LDFENGKVLFDIFGRLQTRIEKLQENLEPGEKSAEFLQRLEELRLSLSCFDFQSKLINGSLGMRKNKKEDLKC